jgi:hypothetical protein
MFIGEASHTLIPSIEAQMAEYYTGICFNSRAAAKLIGKIIDHAPALPRECCRASEHIHYLLFGILTQIPHYFLCLKFASGRMRGILRVVNRSLVGRHGFRFSYKYDHWLMLMFFEGCKKNGAGPQPELHFVAKLVLLF